ncbi:hypothetical protein PG988_008987 [Apiospora saccharicola]
MAVSKGTSHNTAVILASPEFASWSEDQGFMSQLLRTLHQRQRQGHVLTTSGPDESHTDVLFGVVDGIADPYHLHGKPHQGLSILYGGTASLLPSLWDQGKVTGTGDPDKASAVEFTEHEAQITDGQDCRPHVTLPLANTLFQNGRRSTLFASRWSTPSNAGRQMELQRMEEKSHQKVCCWRGMKGLTTRIPLMPLAPPRKIVAGLGNIVRQIEIDGVVSPASKELEMLIPQIFEKRASRAGELDQAPSPIGVWAWVLPARVMERAHFVPEFRTYQTNQNAEEWRLDFDARDSYEGLLNNECRIHKILSGGGGWGAKQGLLSLDPETTYAAPEQDDIDMFIKAFEERNSASEPSSKGIVTPGLYIMFCAEPQHVINDDNDSFSSVDPAGSRLTLAVAPRNEDLPQGFEGAGAKNEKTEVDVVSGYFGAASSTGLYLNNDPLLSFTTKIDAPYSTVTWDWTPPNPYE